MHLGIMAASRVGIDCLEELFLRSKPSLEGGKSHHPEALLGTHRSEAANSSFVFDAPSCDPPTPYTPPIWVVRNPAAPLGSLVVHFFRILLCVLWRWQVGGYQETVCLRLGCSVSAMSTSEIHGITQTSVICLLACYKLAHQFI